MRRGRGRGKVREEEGDERKRMKRKGQKRMRRERNRKRGGLWSGRQRRGRRRRRTLACPAWPCPCPALVARTLPALGPPHPSLESWWRKKSLAASLMAFSGVTRVRLTAAPAAEHGQVGTAGTAPPGTVRAPSCPLTHIWAWDAPGWQGHSNVASSGPSSALSQLSPLTRGRWLGSAGSWGWQRGQALLLYAKVPACPGKAGQAGTSPGGGAGSKPRDQSRLGGIRLSPSGRGEGERGLRTAGSQRQPPTPGPGHSGSRTHSQVHRHLQALGSHLSQKGSHSPCHPPTRSHAASPAHSSPRYMPK